MPRHPARLLTLALIATLLIPTLATSRPLQKGALQSPPKRPASSPDLLARLQGLLSALWAETGSILEPNGSDPGTSSGSGAKPTSDSGSILDPNG